jgi:hypothetical protein
MAEDNTPRVANRYDQAADDGGGITNRPLDEEVANQEALPERGRTKGSAPRQERDDVVARERTGDEEPSRRYDEDVEKNPTLPGDDDPTLRTTI